MDALYGIIFLVGEISLNCLKKPVFANLTPIRTTRPQVLNPSRVLVLCIHLYVPFSCMPVWVSGDGTAAPHPPGRGDGVPSQGED